MKKASSRAVETTPDEVEDVLKQFPVPVTIESRRSRTLYLMFCGLALVPVFLLFAYSSYQRGAFAETGVTTLFSAFFAYCLVRACQMHGTSLRLDAEGFEVFDRYYHWSEVSDFEATAFRSSRSISFKTPKTKLSWRKASFADIYIIEGSEMVRLLEQWKNLATKSLAVKKIDGKLHADRSKKADADAAIAA
jgi:hypothetical protein